MEQSFITQLIGYIASCLTTFSFLPQVIKIWKTKTTSDISLVMYLMFVTGNVTWLLYGVLTKDMPIIFGNTITLALSCSVLILKIKNG